MNSLLVQRPENSPGLIVITLNRPEKLNAVTPEMHAELQQLCGELQEDTETRVVLFTGAGRAFSAGADTSAPRGLGGRSGQNVIQERRRAGMGNRTCAAIERLEQVTIGAINGLTIGGAVAMAASLDIRLAAESAWFSLPEVDRNVALAWGALPRLMRELGPARTKELVMTGDRLSSTEALRWGLVNHVYPDEELMPATLNLVRRLLSKPPMILALLKSATSALAQLMVPEQGTQGDRDLLLLTRRLRAEEGRSPEGPS